VPVGDTRTDGELEGYREAVEVVEGLIPMVTFEEGEEEGVRVGVRVGVKEGVPVEEEVVEGVLEWEAPLVRGGVEEEEGVAVLEGVPVTLLL